MAASSSSGEGTAATAAYRAFLTAALAKQPADRPSAGRLLEADPFVGGARADGLVRLLGALNDAGAAPPAQKAEQGDEGGDTLVLTTE